MISVENLTKNFGVFPAVKNISFNIEKGEVIGLLGPNGAGKTTTMRMMTGYYYPSLGDIRLDGVSIRDNKREIQSKIGYLPESASSYSDMNIADYLTFIAETRELRGEKRNDAIEYAVTSTGLQNYYYRAISQLSKGYKQRVGLAAALLHNPDVLILDEPTSGLDPNQIIEIQNLIKHLAKEKTIILSTHILKEVEDTCQRVIIINNGEIVLDDLLSSLQSSQDNQYKYRVVLKGNVAEAKDKFTQALADNSITSSFENDNTVLKLFAEKNAGEKIFKTAIENNFILTELYPQHKSLEEIFQSLTGGAR